MKLSVIESKIDDIIDSSKLNLFSMIKRKLEGEDASLIEDAVEIIEKDLEEKRTNLKVYFKDQKEKIKEESFNRIIKDYIL